MASTRNESHGASLTPERWKQVKSVLSVALETDPAQRMSYLDSACAADPSLRCEVENLLAIEEQDPTELFRRIPFAETADAPARIGRRVGAYQLVEEIGIGGMGQVYRAFRADDQYKKEVAVKLVRAGQDSKFVIARFKNERQVLASLDHPNIARLLDGGTTEDGVPYFVMDLVEGIPFGEYCNKHKLQVADRLKLFLEACSAVQYAHQRLIIHRDLKPSNILVSGDGIPKLLDFGIAKVIDPVASTENLDATLSMFRLLTPAYASPEQVKGEAITTASDVYSLGVVLYECLTGHHPYGSAARAPHEISRAVCEVEPEKPSTVIRRKETRIADDQRIEITPMSVSAVRGGAPEKLARQLRGDLDSIVLLALRKEPQRRYSSVEQFAGDIRRHLGHLPVTASRDTFLYRTRKFVARAKAGVAAALALFVAIVGGMTATLYEAHRARQNELRAERRFNDVRALANSLLFTIHDSVRDLPGSTPARKLIVASALQYLDSLSAEAAGDASLQRELATAYERVGEVQGHYLLSNLGETANALHSYRQALTLRQEMAKLPGSSWQDKLAVARCSRLVATQQQATGKVTEALGNIHTAISLAEFLRSEHPQEVTILRELSQAYGINAYLHRGGGVFPGLIDPAGESENRRKAISVDEDWLKLTPDSEEAQHALAWDQVNYAETLDPDKKDEALGYFRHSLEVEKKIRAHTNSPERAREIVAVYNRLGMFYDRNGDDLDSIKSHRSALNIEEDVVAKDPKNQHFVENLAVDHANIADGLLKIGQLGESKAEIIKAIGVMEPLVRESPENASGQIMLAEMHVIRGQVLRRSNDPAAALIDYTGALRTYRGLLAKESGNMGPQLSIATCSIGIAKTELQLHRPDEAVASFQAALESLKALISSNKADRRIFYSAADAYADLGRVEAARASHSRSEARLHWEAAANYFQMSLEQLARVSQASFHIDRDNDVGPIDVSQVKKELSRCQSALRSGKP